MTRITTKDLQAQVDRINKLTDSPLSPWEKINNKITANIGNYHLDQAYGGIKLVRMDSEGGGISLVSRNGYGTKSDLYKWMNAFIAGLELRGNV